MEMNDFCNKVKAALIKEMGEETEVRISRVRKNNGIVRHGISAFRPGINITPTIYLEDFLKRYEDGETFSNIVAEVSGILTANRKEGSFDVSCFADLQKAKYRIVYKLVGRSRNEELLREVPHMTHLDMAIVFYYLLHDDSAESHASILIRNEHISKWGITAEELYGYALANTGKLLPSCFRHMEELMQEILSGSRDGFWRRQKETDTMDADLEELLAESGRIPMYVLTNTHKYYGAACILYPGLLKKTAEAFRDDFYILPSSVHEVILLPARGIDSPTQLLNMVREVNATVVQEEEILSDSVYFYNRELEQVDVLQDSVMAE